VKMWSGGQLDPEFEQWQRSFSFDQRLLGEEIAASSAHAKALERIGMISRDELARMLEGLAWIQAQARSDPRFIADDEAEDVHHFVEKRLVERVGDVGYKLHSGRSRNEQIATDLRLYVRKSIETVQQLLAETVSTLLDRAREAGDAVMPSYTHLQRAEPVLVAHWMLSYVEMFLRDMDRLSDCHKRLNRCPLGSGAVAGSTLPVDRGFIARELGFDAPTGNSIDSVSDRDFSIEFVQALSSVALHLSRWAEELILFSTQEFGFISLPETHATGSSAMPQKKNPDALELIRGQAGSVIADSLALQIAFKGLPQAYNKDLQETQRPLFRATDTIAAALRVNLGIVAGFTFNTAAMRAAAETGFLNAMSAATWLAKQGVPFRLAHQKIASAIRLCIEKGCELQDLSLEELQRFGSEFNRDFYAALTLDAVLTAHDVVGGTAPHRVRQAITDAQHRLSAFMGEVHAHA
jgi:argininosuccinate lyase